MPGRPNASNIKERYTTLICWPTRQCLASRTAAHCFISVEHPTGARDVFARYCDMFLMWSETEEMLHQNMLDVSARAESYGKKVNFGLRVHVIVPETESEARACAKN